MAKFSGLELLREESEPRQDSSAEEVPVSSTSKIVAKPVGKRQNPEYVQISAYVRRTDYEAVRRNLIGTKLDFSDLLEQWISEWLKGRGSESPKQSLAQ